MWHFYTFITIFLYCYKLRWTRRSYGSNVITRNYLGIKEKVHMRESYCNCYCVVNDGLKFFCRAKMKLLCIIFSISRLRDLFRFLLVFLFYSVSSKLGRVVI